MVPSLGLWPIGVRYDFYIWKAAASVPNTCKQIAALRALQDVHRTQALVLSLLAFRHAGPMGGSDSVRYVYGVKEKLEYLRRRVE